jgi:RNA polymerase sigma factor (sigma-70 family)
MGYSIGVAKAIVRASPLPADPDLELVRRMARGDEDALGEVYQRYASGLLAYLLGRLDDARLAEEVLQDVMLAAWRNARRFRGECRVRTWLLTITRSRAINAYHRQIKPRAGERRLEEAEAGEGAASREAYGDYDELQAALRALPSEQRETLELVFYHGLSLEEAARVLKVAPGTVKSRLHRAKARLREWMKDK